MKEMKKKFFVFFFVPVLFVFLFTPVVTSCSSDDSDDGGSVVENNGGEEVTRVTIEFDGNGASLSDEHITISGSMENQTFEKGVSAAIFVNAFIISDESYAFAGWATSASGEVVYKDGAQAVFESNTKLYAIWKKGYSVTFDINAATLPEGYTPTGSMTKQFFPLGESGTASVTQALNECAFSCECFKVSGWSESSSGNKLYNDKAAISISKNTTLYAKWSRTHYKVNFNKNGEDVAGSGMASVIVPISGSITLPECTYKRAGYNFLGWSTYSSSSSATYTDKASISGSGLYSDKTLYAVWKVKECSVTFSANGAESGSVTDSNKYKYGETEYDSKTYTYVGKFIFPENSFIYSGHKFLGWTDSATMQSDSKVYEAGKKVTWLWDGDQQFYAVWQDESDDASKLKMNGTLLDADNITFTSATNTFTGLLTGGDFSKIVSATKTASVSVNLDFSGCSGLVFTIEDASYNSTKTLAGVNASGYSDKNEKLTSIKLPNNLSKVSDYAFYKCTNLLSVTVGSATKTVGKSAFSNCSKLATVTLGESVETLGSSAFSSTALSSISIGKNVKSIDTGMNSTFSSSKLATITVELDNENYSAIDNVLFNKDKTKLLFYPPKKSSTSYIVPASVKEICDYAMDDQNDTLTSITLGSAVKSVGRYGVCGGKLTTITLNEGLESLGSYALGNNSSLTAIVLPATLKTIGESAFYRCSKLRAINIPASVTSIGKEALITGDYLGSALSQITVDSENKNYEADGKALFNKGKTLLISYAVANAATSYNIPNTVTKLEKKAFKDAKNLTSVFIPSSVTTIETNTTESYGYLYSPFLGCKSSLILNCQAESAPVGFGFQWNYYGNGTPLTVNYGQTAPTKTE